MKEYINDFRTFTKDIITYEIDNRPDRVDRGESIERNDFWTNIYERRSQKEEDSFHSSIMSDNNLILLVASVGSGKSTFVRHKLEYLNKYNGILIDFRGKRENLNDISLNNEDTFSLILRDAHYNLLRFNTSIAIQNDGKYLDYTYRNDFKAEIKNNDPIFEDKVRKQIAIYALTHLSEFEDIQELISDILGNIEADDIEGLNNVYQQSLKREQISNIIKKLSYYHLIRLIQRLNKNNLPYLVVLDNFERMNYKKFNDFFIESICSLLSKLNGVADGHARNMSDPIVKFIFVVRDENISRVNLAAVNAFKYSAITLTDRAYSFPQLTSVQKLPLTEGLAKKIIQNRLKLVNKYYESRDDIFDLRVLNYLFEEFWLSDANKVYDEYKIFELCNGSLRILLDIIVDFSFELIDTIKSLEIKENEFERLITINFLRSKLIRSLWKEDNENIIHRLVKSVEGELNSKYCCLYRLILAYLYNNFDKKTTFHNLKKSINKLFDTDLSDTIKSSLFGLYNSSNSLGDLIIIDQIDYVRSSDLIDENAIIRLTKKGETFIHSLLLNLEFYNIVCNRNYDENITLFESDVKSMINKLDRIQEDLIKLIKIHLEVFNYDIIPNIGRANINQYKREFQINKTFHIIRVLSSHKSYVGRYLMELLKGEDGKLLIGNAEHKQHLEYNSINQMKRFNKKDLDHEMIQFIKTLPKENPIFWLYKRYEKYARLISQVKRESVY